MVEIGKTTEFWVPDLDGNDPSYNLADVAAIADIPLTSDTIEDTTYGSDLWKTFMGGLREGGTFTLTLNYDQSDSSHNFLMDNYLDGSSNKYKVVFPDTTYMTFSALVTDISVAVPLAEKVQRTFTFKIDGKTVPTFSEL